MTANPAAEVTGQLHLHKPDIHPGVASFLSTCDVIQDEISKAKEVDPKQVYFLLTGEERDALATIIRHTLIHVKAEPALRALEGLPKLSDWEEELPETKTVP